MIHKPRIAQPIQVGQIPMKNRTLMVAMHTLYPENGGPSPRFNEFYLRRAEGGAGLIVVGACRFDTKGAKLSCMSLAEPDSAARWQSFTRAMHEKDCPVAVQLYHAGRYMKDEEVPDGKGAIAPSAVFTPFTRQTARAMTREEIHAVIRAWAEAAARAREAGFDAVEISASAGYLISQFLSPMTNLREDEYGGSEENRFRFPLEVIAAVRRAVGQDYTVLLRYGVHTLVPGAGGSELCVDFAKKAADAGIDLLDLTGGWHESRTPQLTQEAPEGALLYLAKRIRETVDIPVAMANRMSEPRVAETALALGRCDIIAMGRPMIADPDLPRKLCTGDVRHIRPCLSCNQGCLAGTFFEKPIRCLSNPEAGREYEHLAVPAAQKKRVLVVGGGPAGMQCAVTAAGRGHEVELWERADAPGGQLRMTGAIPAREKFGELLESYAVMLAEAGVTVRLGKTADAAAVLAGGFDVCVLANGRDYKPVSVERTADSVPVLTHEALLLERPVLPGRVAVIGGSFVGLETARMLTLEGSAPPEELFHLLKYEVEPDDALHGMTRRSDRSVAVFERGKLGAGYEPGIAWTVLGDLKRFGVKLAPNTQVLRITAEGVVTEQETWPCDAVVFCPGTQPDDGLYEAVRERLTCYKIGNAERPGRGIDAIAAGYEIGCLI